MKLSIAAFFATFAAFSAFAGTELVWDEPSWERMPADAVVEAGALALANASISSIYDTFQLFIGTLTSGLSCLFFMGVFIKRVDGRAAFAGLLANYVVCAALRFAPWGGKPHILAYGACGMAACLAVSLSVSIFTRRKR